MKYDTLTIISPNNKNDNDHYIIRKIKRLESSDICSIPNIGEQLHCYSNADQSKFNEFETIFFEEIAAKYTDQIGIFYNIVNMDFEGVWDVLVRINNRIIGTAFNKAAMNI